MRSLCGVSSNRWPLLEACRKLELRLPRISRVTQISKELTQQIVFGVFSRVYAFFIVCQEGLGEGKPGKQGAGFEVWVRS